MTKKHFQEIAEILRNKIVPTSYQTQDAPTVRQLNTAVQIAYDLCPIFKKLNPRFDKQKFLAACGIKE